MMELLQSPNITVCSATITALNKKSLNISDCYKIYTNSKKSNY